MSTPQGKTANQPTARIERTLRRNRWLTTWWGFLTILFSAAAIAYQHRWFETMYLAGALASAWAVGALVVFRLMFRRFLIDFLRAVAADSPEKEDPSQRSTSASLASLTEMAARYEKLWPAVAAITAVLGLLVVVVNAVLGT